jgi:hypothetical protein
MTDMARRLDLDAWEIAMVATNDSAASKAALRSVLCWLWPKRPAAGHARVARTLSKQLEQ